MNDRFASSTLADRRVRAAWLVAGTVLTVVALLAGIAAVGTSIWATVSPSSAAQPSPQPSTVVETEHRSHARAAAAIDIDVPNGDVSILAGNPDRVDVERTLRWSDIRPTIDETWTGGTFQIRADCPSTASSRSRVCKVDHVVQVPAAAATTVRTAAGKIEVRDIDAELSLSTAAGAIILADVSGPVSARSSAGDVSGTGLRSHEVEIRVDTGTVDLRFDTAPDQVSVEATAGRVTIEVPPGDPYQVRVNTTVGVERVEVAHDPDADRLIEVRTTAGEVEIRNAP